MRLFDRIKSKIAARGATPKGGQTYQSIMATLLGVQTITSFENPSKAFPILMTDLKAAGYVLGFHDALAQHLYGRNVARAMPEVQESYERLFGQQAGYVLFTKSMQDQEKPAFQEGRLQGGTEMFAYIERGVHPLGLMNHLVSGPKDTKKPSSALTKFEKTIASWEPKQAKIAVAILAEILKGDRGPMETIFGKGISVEVAFGHLTIVQVRVLHSALKEITAELGIDLDENEDENEDE